MIYWMEKKNIDCFVIQVLIQHYWSQAFFLSQLMAHKIIEIQWACLFLSNRSHEMDNTFFNSIATNRNREKCQKFLRIGYRYIVIFSLDYA